MSSALQVGLDDYFALNIDGQVIHRLIIEFVREFDVVSVYREVFSYQYSQGITGSPPSTTRLLTLQIQ